MAPELPEIDTERPNAARMYDYFLGGAHHFAADRAQADLVAARMPEIVTVARANRDFLGRVVTWCLGQGIRQFLDLGSGVPTVGNVHEIAQRHDPAARVAYVDVEPVAAAHARQILAEVEGATATRADLRDVDAVLTAASALLDLGEPVAVLAVAVLHFVPDDPEPVADVLARYRARLAPGSVLALSHSSADQDDPELAARVRAGIDAYRGTASEPTRRDRTAVRALLGDLELVPPGVVDVVHWPTPHPTAAATGLYAAVGRASANPG
ncbi:SAM-dependent methyltransferase [Actinomycetospora sp. NBRC 106378]|uniref:SAM-dependent methyltransferase n=1 Tax=Actinomycetospora sp. NBRC 106378 TaxID=3032208 RepID=UPI0024A28FF5|nr:SAM-dependent methyltransferase [Actinomycetospora sp. NBRC 106378]GLZ56328.1 hypothetical protein Acsp07_59450 [Actinomycetospora sp. NBRC 106378]